MNLHGIAAPYIGTVNPFVPGQIETSAGYATAADGSTTPIYNAPVTGLIQIQALTYKDLMQLDGLNLAGKARRVYFYGDLQGVARVSQQGGDKFTITGGPSAGLWLIVHVLETWPDWSACACVLQSPA